MLPMRQSYRIIPVYTADVSGVCSALYELGGMTVMHDPSGCNSTYNTHDELRWYDQDSLIYISGLTEIDAIMGNDEKFLDDIKEAAIGVGINQVAVQKTQVINGLMQELLELNILRHTVNEKYLFSRYSFFQMMGTSDEIDSRLLEYMENQ